jgi:hypothetical protein
METKNKNGDISLYGLRCGYVQEETIEGSNFYWKKQLYMEHNTLHVKTIIVEKNWNNFNDRVWESFSTNELTKARVLFRSLKPVFSERSRFSFNASWRGAGMYATGFYDCEGISRNDCKSHAEKWYGGKLTNFSFWDLKMQ